MAMTFLPGPVFAGISCVEENGEPANMTECLRWAGPLPLQKRQCRVPCKDDCTLSAWSRFSDCAGCGSSRSRRRSLTGRDSILIHTMWDTVSCFALTSFGQAASHWIPISKKHLKLSVCCLSCSLLPFAIIRGLFVQTLISLFTFASSSGLLSMQSFYSCAEKPFY